MKRMRFMFLLLTVACAALLLSACGLVGGGEDTTAAVTTTVTTACTDHRWGEGTVYEPTCTSSGETVYYCSVCGERRSEPIPSTGHTFSAEWSSDDDEHWHDASCGCMERSERGTHTWDEGRVTTPPTCAERGVYTYTCTVCARTRPAPIECLPHTYSEGWVADDDGHYRAMACGCPYYKGERYSHEWDEGTVTTPSTCTERGVITKTCTVCGATWERAAPLADHTYATEWMSDAGYHWHEAICGCEGKRTIRQTHTWDAGTVTTPPTCTVAGVRTYVCTECLREKTVAISPTRKHIYEESVIAPTCTAEGYTLHDCTTCDASYKDTYTEKLSHTYEAAVTAPTCTARGYTKHTCTACGASYKDTYTAILPHTYKAEVIPSACEAEGYTTHVCTSCGDHYEDTYTEALGHDYQKTVTLPTCTGWGYDSYVCLRCEDRKTNNYQSPFPHRYTNGFCTGCGLNEYSMGLAYTVSEDGTYCTISGIGTCEDTALTLPHTHNGLPVRGIAPSAFLGNTVITSVTFLKGDGVQAVGASAFRGCTALGEIALPVGLKTVGDAAFADCPTLKKVTLPDGITALGDAVFENCTKLWEIAIPDSVTSIGASLLRGCSDLRRLSVPYIGAIPADTENTHIGYFFGGADHTENGAVLPRNLGDVYLTGGSFLADYAFYGCQDLTTVKLPTTLESIGRSVFSGCGALMSLTVPYIGACLDDTENTHIGYFFGAADHTENGAALPRSLYSVTLRGGSFLADYAFFGCERIKRISLPQDLASIGTWVFHGCSLLESISIDSRNPVYHVSGDCLIETATKTLVVGCAGSVIPGDGSVTAIGDYAFYGCTGLTSIVIPAEVDWIGIYAFTGCTSLTSAVFENTVDWFLARTYELAIKRERMLGGDEYLNGESYVAQKLTSFSDDRYWYVTYEPYQGVS